MTHLQSDLARFQASATLPPCWVAVCVITKEMLMSQFIWAQKSHHENNVYRVYFISLQYLLSQLLTKNEISHGILDDTKRLEILGQNPDDIVNVESDMEFWNRGLGRLASCSPDFLATLHYPAVAYGIHYELGLFARNWSMRSK
jgi:starch phosphorylase